MIKITDILRKVIFEEKQKLLERTETPYSRSNIKTVVLRVFFEDDISTYDILTGIRVIENVATVYSIGSTDRSIMGRSILDAKINYIPLNKKHAEYVDFLARTIRNINGVKVVKILKIGKKRLTQDIGPVKKVY